jgi:hypothetical protein
MHSFSFTFEGVIPAASRLKIAQALQSQRFQGIYMLVETPEKAWKVEHVRGLTRREAAAEFMANLDPLILGWGPGLALGDRQVRPDHAGAVRRRRVRSEGASSGPVTPSHVTEEVHVTARKGGERMSTTEEKQDDQTLTVTYRIAEGVSNDQAREMIQSNAPEGLSIEGFEGESS